MEPATYHCLVDIIIFHASNNDRYELLHHHGIKLKTEKQDYHTNHHTLDLDALWRYWHNAVSHLCSFMIQQTDARIFLMINYKHFLIKINSSLSLSNKFQHFVNFPYVIKLLNIVWMVIFNHQRNLINIH